MSPYRTAEFREISAPYESRMTAAYVSERADAMMAKRVSLNPVDFARIASDLTARVEYVPSGPCRSCGVMYLATPKGHVALVADVDAPVGTVNPIPGHP